MNDNQLPDAPTVEAGESSVPDAKASGPTCSPIPLPDEVAFTDDEIALVRAAIMIAKKDMKEWRRLSRVDPEKMREPLWRP